MFYRVPYRFRGMFNYSNSQTFVSSVEHCPGTVTSARGFRELMLGARSNNARSACSVNVAIRSRDWITSGPRNGHLNDPWGRSVRRPVYTLPRFDAADKMKSNGTPRFGPPRMCMRGKRRHRSENPRDRRRQDEISVFRTRANTPFLTLS